MFAKLFSFGACVFLSSIAFAGTSVPETTKASPRHIVLSNSVDPKLHGNILLSVLPNKKIKIVGIIHGLTPGMHGFHVHAIGDCSDATDGFKKSGGHFNPSHANHGSLLDGHAGDLGNILADKKGNSSFTIIVNKFNLKENDAFSIIGKALIVHAGVYDEETNPAGNAGPRVLCGVVE